MEKQIKGTAYVFDNNIDTDQIYPGKYVEYTELEDIKKYAMSGSAEPDFAKIAAVGDIIVAGTNFGCGSSREHAAMTLKAVGVGAILAESFGRIFFRNAVNIGLPVVVCPKIRALFKRGDEAAVDFATGEIKNLTTGETAKAVPLSDYMMNILASGGIKPMIKAQLAKAKVG